MGRGAGTWPGAPSPVWWEGEPAERPVGNQKWGRRARKGGKEPVALKHGVRARRVPKGSVAFVLQALVMAKMCDGGKDPEDFEGVGTQSNLVLRDIDPIISRKRTP